MSYSSAHFLGIAGQDYVSSVLLERGWNVAATEVDVGDDLLAVRHTDAELSRIQVKTSGATPHDYGYSAHFLVGKAQLRERLEPPHDYVFVVHLGDRWGPSIVFPQTVLRELVVNDGMGSQNANHFQFYIRFELDQGEIDRVDCTDHDITQFVDDFSHWERIEH